MLRQPGIFFLIFLFSFPALAENGIRYYDVEFILFENIGLKNRQSENWQTRRRHSESKEDEPVHELGTPYVLEHGSSYDRNAMFSVIPHSGKRLLEEARLIEKSPNRRVLAHIAWRQPGLPKENAIWVHFKKILNTKDTEQISRASTAELLTGANQFHPYIEGRLKVMLARYLHVDTDILYFTNPLPGSTSVNNNETVVPDSLEMFHPASQEPEVFLMHQLRRRIRSKELHYLDHPVMGMLLMITPYEKETQSNRAAK